MRVVVVVDGAHLLAAVGRSTGLGAQRRGGRFDAPHLVSLLLGLLPQTDREGAEVVWIDGVVEGVDVPEHDALGRVPGVRLELFAVRGGRQRDVEVAVLDLFVALALGDPARVLLVGDPRRHGVALGRAAALRLPVGLVGVAGGETTPARRLWLRRVEVLQTARSRGATRTVSARLPYRPPTVRLEQMRTGM